jgi:hypothetical protein
VLESANVILYCDSFISVKTVDIDGPDTVLTDREYRKTAPVMYIAVPLTHNLSKTEADKVTKYENLAAEGL